MRCSVNIEIQKWPETADKSWLNLTAFKNSRELYSQTFSRAFLEVVKTQRVCHYLRETLQNKMRIKQIEIKQNKIPKVLIIFFSQLQHIFKRETMLFCLWFLKLRKSNISCFATLLKSHFDMGVLLQICCIFSEHLFSRTSLEDSF